MGVGTLDTPHEPPSPAHRTRVARPFHMGKIARRSGGLPSGEYGGDTGGQAAAEEGCVRYRKDARECEIAASEAEGEDHHPKKTKKKKKSTHRWRRSKGRGDFSACGGPEAHFFFHLASGPLPHACTHEGPIVESMGQWDRDRPARDMPLWWKTKREKTASTREGKAWRQKVAATGRRNA